MIELVIKIPEDSYKATCSGSMLPPDVKNVVNAIKNGTPLPKGHGALKDTDQTIKAIEFEHKRNDRPFRMSEKYVVEHNVPTIVEADTESEET